MNQEQNHPKKGEKIKVQPITSKKDIATIKKLLADKSRDLALFTIGINTAFRASDLRNLKVSHFKGLKAGDSFESKELKTLKTRCVTVNSAVLNAVDGLVSSGDYDEDDYLFKSQRAHQLTVSAINRMVKSWCKAINLKGNYGSHTLRKTWGYHQRITFKQDLPVLMECLNHSSQKQTLEYLCIQSDEIKCVYLNEL